MKEKEIIVPNKNKFILSRKGIEFLAIKFFTGKKNKKNLIDSDQAKID